jgi:hypothetical protein
MTILISHGVKRIFGIKRNLPWNWIMTRNRTAEDCFGPIFNNTPKHLFKKKYKNKNIVSEYQTRPSCVICYKMCYFPIFFWGLFFLIKVPLKQYNI